MRLKIGQNPNKDFQIFLGDEDVTDRMVVKSLRVSVDPVSMTTATMEVYIDHCDIDIDNTRVNLLPLRRVKRSTENDVITMVRNFWNRRKEQNDGR